MVEEEFCLSEHLKEYFPNGFWIHNSKLKEFIKKIKYKFQNDVESGYIDDEQVEYEDFIDKLAGPKLIQNKPPVNKVFKEGYDMGHKHAVKSIFEVIDDKLVITPEFKEWERNQPNHYLT